VRSEPVARSEARSEVVIAAFVFSARSVFLIFRCLQKSRSSPSLAKPHYPLLSRPRKGTGGHFLHNEIAIAKLLLVPAPVPVWGAQESIVRIPTSVAATFVVCACCSTGSCAATSALKCRRQRPPFLAHFSQPSGRRTAPRHPWSLPRELVRQYLPLAAGEQYPARIHRRGACLYIVSNAIAYVLDRDHRHQRLRCWPRCGPCWS